MGVCGSGALSVVSPRTSLIAAKSNPACLGMVTSGVVSFEGEVGGEVADTGVGASILGGSSSPVSVELRDEEDDFRVNEEVDGGRET